MLYFYSYLNGKKEITTFIDVFYLTVFSFDQFLSFYKMSIEDEFQNE